LTDNLSRFFKSNVQTSKPTSLCLLMVQFALVYYDALRSMLNDWKTKKS
jgi:hypothetical protein